MPSSPQPHYVPTRGEKALRYINLILWREVRGVYSRREAWLWLRHHRRQGTSLGEQRRLIHSLVTGAFA